MSLYGPEGYAFTVAQIGAGLFVEAADPGPDDDLMDRSRALRDEAAATRDVRLLDAIRGPRCAAGWRGRPRANCW